MIRDNRLTDNDYARNFTDIHPPFETRDAALVDANRCLFCYDAPCTKSCPTGIDVPKFIKQIATDDIKGSARTIFISNIMGGGCSRVCPVEKLCEGACVYNLMEEAPIPIARLQRYPTDQAIRHKWPLFARKASNGHRVAIIGAGPAGLSAAHTLSREGVDVTIYEKEEKGGGLMTYGVAAYKVTPEYCLEELEYILSLGGITIQFSTELGKDVQLEQLRDEYDAVFLAFGVGLARRLGIPGEDLSGVVDALRFIYAIRTDGFPSVPVGDKVAVIGMGMTAIDAATQARRLGAGEVTLVYRRTEEEMPCTEKELEIARLDGCRIHWLAAPDKLIGLEGRVTQLRCQKMELGPPDAGGRRMPRPTGETFDMDVDMVIKATGQMPFEDLVATGGLSHRNGKIGTTGSHGITSFPGVFAGGDCVNGGKEVVDAVQAGKLSAAAILSYLQTV
ncbi:MAG TPA: NAD(P)-dependent oxidoreductase [Puia sp.]|jgi:glutamate synthase (NADPH/NADH) small chain